MAEHASEIAILRRLFFRRFFDNDLVAPNGGGEQKMALIYAALMAPGLLASAPLLLKYAFSPPTPGRRLLMGLDDTLLCVSVSMLVMAIATVLCWDALSLDARDVAVLGPLPLTRRTLVVAKLQSLGLFVGTVGVAVNLLPSALFPPILWGTLQISLMRGVWLIMVHALVSIAAGCFGFLAVFACRQALALVSSQRLFRRLSAVAQPALLLLLVTTFLLVPALPSATKAARALNGELPALGPPGWFLGLHEVMSGGLVLSAPGVVSPIGRSRVVLPGAERDRQRYLDHMPEFAHRARTAVVAFGIVAMIAVAGYASESRRMVRRIPPTRLGTGRLTRQAARLARAWIVRDPLSRATFFFTLQTLSRGPSQRLYLSSGLAVACAALILFVPRQELNPMFQGTREPEPWFLSVQTFLIAALVGSLRMVATVPAELRANWTFRVTWLHEAGPYLAGVRRVGLIVAAVPTLVLAPLSVMASGMAVALVHGLFGLLVGALLVEWMCRDLRVLPFTCAADPGTSRALLLRVAVKVVVATGLLGRLEYWGYGTPMRAGLAFGVVGVGLVLAATLRQRQQREWQDVKFEEPFVPHTQRLGISSGTD